MQHDLKVHSLKKRTSFILPLVYSFQVGERIFWLIIFVVHEQKPFLLCESFNAMLFLGKWVVFICEKLWLPKAQGIMGIKGRNTIRARRPVNLLWDNVSYIWQRSYSMISQGHDCPNKDCTQKTPTDMLMQKGTTHGVCRSYAFYCCEETP